jgi:hypothetical protein
VQVERGDNVMNKFVRIMSISILLVGVLIVFKGLAGTALKKEAMSSVIAGNEYPAVKVTRVDEDTRLKLYKGAGSGSAPAGTRIVIITLDLPETVGYVDQHSLRLIGSNKVFPCGALGDREEGYIPENMSPYVTRRGAQFEGGSGWGKIKVKKSNLAGAFIVPNTIPIDALQLLYSFLDKDVPLDPPSATPLPSGVSAGVKEASVHPASPGDKVLIVSLEIKNAGSEPFPVHFGTFRLATPLLAAKKEQPEWVWTVAGPLIKDLAVSGPKGKHHLSVSVAPGETRSVEIQFQVFGDFSPRQSKLGFFREVAFPLRSGH